MERVGTDSLLSKFSVQALRFGTSLLPFRLNGGRDGDPPDRKTPCHDAFCCHIKLLICCKTAAIAALDDKLFLSSFLISVVEKPTSSLGRDSWFSTVLCAVAAKGFLMPEGFQFRFIDVEAFPQTQGCCCSSSSTTRVGFEEIVIGSHGGGKMEVGLLCGGGGVEVGLLRNGGF
ncbi:hypothetical protein Fot_39127 [Forsythia ovata]|uniref:Uncharacterized protein n=1 Tax=Forsythia ovata TaxID=205694 RepID=A0ABD1S3R8_9LAMI